MRCNGAFRFDELVAFAERAGAEELWTGHYARLVERAGMRLDGRADDEHKDQSYMLSAVDPALLERVRFPLGEQTKARTRDEAAAAGLAAAHRLESQEACFLGGDDYRSFLERQGVRAEPGAIVDTTGTRVGTHAGHWQYTIGQRRGLRVHAARPLYVLGTDASSNTIVVGPRDELAVTSIRATGRMYLPVERAEVKVRHRSDSIAARVGGEVGGFSVELEEPAYGVARGQFAVLYDDGAVVGAGLITDVARVESLGSIR
jgi:tRNA-specific 2-thiouridylase